MSAPKVNQRARVKQPVDGVLLVDKPQGPSSNSVLQHVRRLFDAEKAGHGGTLDPMATGLLIVCFGEATKYSSGLLKSQKRYSGTITLGARTNTADAEGEVIEQCPVQFNADALEVARRSLLGEMLQQPPAYSAIKVNGQPAYAYARAGVQIEHAARPITIYDFSLTRAGATEIQFNVHCSTGTYVRTLAEDLARALGTVGHLSALRREASGPFNVEAALPPEALAALSTQAKLLQLLAVDAPLYDLPTMRLGDLQILALQQGKSVAASDQVLGKSKLYSANGQFVGVVETLPDQRIVPVRLMRTATVGAAVTPPR